MENSNVDIPKEITTMWNAYKQLSNVWPTLKNPEGEINSCVLDVIVETSDPQFLSLTAFGIYLKFILSSHKNGVLLPPTKDVFDAWYNNV
jgi:hypothetical protein